MSTDLCNWARAAAAAAAAKGAAGVNEYSATTGNGGWTKESAATARGNGGWIKESAAAATESKKVARKVARGAEQK